MEGGGCTLSPIYLGSSILSSRASCILATVKVEMFSGYSFCAQLYYSGSNTKYSTLMNNHFISIKAEKKTPKLPLVFWFMRVFIILEFFSCSVANLLIFSHLPLWRLNKTAAEVDSQMWSVQGRESGGIA